MELWIRSQNRQLIKKANYEICYNERNGHNYIVIDGDVLGSYKTKERALEILDEIQKMIQPPANFIVSQHIDFENDGEGLIGVNVLKEEPKIEKISDIIVYEMPKE